MKTVVYIAGPVGKPDEGREARVIAGVETAARVISAGFSVISPHLFCRIPGADELLDWDGWMDVCLALVERCDAVVRIPGESPGADKEVVRARERSIPVFFSVDELLVADIRPRVHPLLREIDAAMRRRG